MFLSDNYLATSPVQGVFDALRRLVEVKFGENLHVVSKCGEDTEKKSLHWLRHHHFFARSGIRPGNVHFCRRRSDKAPICRRLGVTHFVDDRLEVLSQLETVGVRYLFQPRPEEVEEYEEFLPYVRQVTSWQEILDLELLEMARADLL